MLKEKGVHLRGPGRQRLLIQHAFWPQAVQTVAACTALERLNSTENGGDDLCIALARLHHEKVRLQVGELVLACSLDPLLWRMTALGRRREGI